MRREADHTGPGSARRHVLLLLWAAALVAAPADPAHAVVPGLTGPLQALSQMLPQVLPFLVAAVASALSIPAWRARLGRLAALLITRRSALWVAAVLAGGGVVVQLGRGPSRSVPALAASAAGAVGDWAMFRANPERTGGDGGPGPASARVVWSFRDPDARRADFASSPAVAGGRVYVGSAEASVFDTSGMVYCLDAATGRQIWRFQTEKQVFSSPAVSGGRVYVGEGVHVDDGCRLYCLDAATGKLLWSVVTAGHTESSPAVSGGRVFFGAGEDGLYCLDAATGRTVWHYPGAHVDVSPVVFDGRVFVGTGYGKLAAMALDAATGKPVWTSPSPLPVWGPPAAFGGRVYFGTGNGDFVKSATSPRGAVWCLEAATGRQAWRTELPDSVLTAVVAGGDRVFAGCRDGRVYALDTANGRVAWSAACGGPVVASPAADAGRLFVAAGGALRALARQDGKPAWTLDLRPSTAPDVLLFSSPKKLLCLGK